MNFKKVIGILVLLGGISTLLFAFYIQTQLNQGKRTVEQAQKAVDKGSILFKINPVTEEMGKGISNAAQKKIDEGKREIIYYQGVVQQLLIGGAIITLVGGLIILWGMKKKNT